MSERIVITGASSGLGKCIFGRLVKQASVINWDLMTGVDLKWDISVEAAAHRVREPIDILINCAGVNALDWFPNVSAQDMQNVMDVNAFAIYRTTKALLEKLRGGTVLNIISNASHVPMTCSLAYNASKAAAHMMTLQMARELKKTHDITVFGISPNKLKNTGMSAATDARVPELRGWTPEQAAEYQRAALPSGEETDPEVLAEFIAFLLSNKERHKYLNGCILQYGA